MGRVIVGVDGSEESKRALAFAVDEARMRRATLDVVYVRRPVASSTESAVLREVQAGTGPAQSFDQAVAEARDRSTARDERERERAERLLDEMLDGYDIGPLHVERTVLVDLRPARRRVDHAAASDVDLLVVGSRGRGELTGMLLGSVSQACVTHAPCPVTVVRPRR